MNSTTMYMCDCRNDSRLQKPCVWREVAKDAKKGFRWNREGMDLFNCLPERCLLLMHLAEQKKVE